MGTRISVESGTHFSAQDFDHHSPSFSSDMIDSLVIGGLFTPEYGVSLLGREIFSSFMRDLLDSREYSVSVKDQTKT